MFILYYILPGRYIHMIQPAAAWWWIGSLRIFRLGVYGFVICCSPLNVVGAHFAFLGMTLASLWLPWDAGVALWGALGSH